MWFLSKVTWSPAACHMIICNIARLSIVFLVTEWHNRVLSRRRQVISEVSHARDYNVWSEWWVPSFLSVLATSVTEIVNLTLCHNNCSTEDDVVFATGPLSNLQVSNGTNISISTWVSTGFNAGASSLGGRGETHLENWGWGRAIFSPLPEIFNTPLIELWWAWTYIQCDHMMCWEGCG